MKKTTWSFKGQFSWEKPIEDEMLEFASHMLIMWQGQSHRFSGFFGDSRKDGEVNGNITAYKTMIEHLEKEIRIRKLAKAVEGGNKQ